MRITNLMMNNTMKHNINNNMLRLSKYNEEISTGRRINKPSDDPAGLLKSMRFRTDLVENDQYMRNISDGISFVETVDGALGELNDVLQRIRELTVKAANGTNDDGALKAISEEITTLKDHIGMVANTAYGNKFVFGGTNVTVPPCGESEWVGNGITLETEIGTSITMPLNIDMRGFFGTPPEGGFDPNNPAAADGGIFAVMGKLLHDIDNGDFDAINGNLGDLDLKIDELLNQRSVIGARVNRMELMENRMKTAKVSLNGLLSKHEDADIAESNMNLKMQEYVYRASLAVGAKIIQPSLVDFLR